MKTQYTTRKTPKKPPILLRNKKINACWCSLKYIMRNWAQLATAVVVGFYSEVVISAVKPAFDALVYVVKLLGVAS